MVPVLLCHGVLGSPADAEMLRLHNPDHDIHALDSFATGAIALTGDPPRLPVDGPIHVVVCSIGAMAAIRIAGALPERVQRLTLISAAAPLELGPFLPDMAGRMIFDMAMRRPVASRGITLVQGIFARLAPDLMTRVLFLNSGSVERALLQDSAVRNVSRQALRNSFVDNPNRYGNAVTTYGLPWAADLDRVTCPVELWHGTSDTWSPSAMATALAGRFADPATLIWVERGEHYSTLAPVKLS